MKNKIKLTSTAVLGAIFWVLLILLIVTVTRSDFKDSISSKQLVSGIISVIVVLFLFRFVITLRILLDKNTKQHDSLDKSLIYWGMISGDFLFGATLIWRNYLKK